MQIRGVFLVASLVGLLSASFSPGQKPNQVKVNFGRDILPILSDKCFKCHGPDAGSRVADLRLDTSAGAFANRGGRFAIVPGKPASSLLVARINHDDTPMPPRESGKSLSAEEKTLMTRWITEGAQYGKLWSFEPLPRTVAVPNVKSNWPKDDLDRFVLDRLNREKLKPSPAASRERWLRRVCLDLTGLPPTEPQIAAFQQDGNFDRVADELLASEHFGERLAVDWLDAARYSDSYGYQSDLLMPSWPYRDWVVRAFNQNKPYDQFLTEQVAGDLLTNPTTDQVLATAFNRLHRQSNEGGSIAEEFKTEYAVDRVSTFGTAMMGLTLGCANCHDHKFDPISQKEFYQLYAYFNSINEYGLLLSTEIVPTPSVLLPSKEQEIKLAELKQKDLEAKLGVVQVLTTPETARFSLDTYTDKFIDTGSGKASGRKLGDVTLVDGKKGKAALFNGENGIALKELGGRERWDAFRWSFFVSDPQAAGPVVLLHRTGGTDVGFCGFDLILQDGYLIARVMRHWPGNAVAVRSQTRLAKNEWEHVTWSWDGSGSAAGLAILINGKPVGTTVLADKLWKSVNAYGDHGPSGGDWCFGQRFREAGFKGGKIDEIEFTTYSPSTVNQAQRELANFENTIPEISVMEEAKPEIPAYLLARGDYDAPRTEANRVSRGVPAILPALTLEPNNRLALAKWATHPDHPLTSRVAVNRLWQMIFGTGLVETSENFGVQGSQPLHPELLDFLARRFVNDGWNVKKFVRNLVLSATYRQDSIRRGDRDPFNRLYARGPSNRLSAEMVRDSVLAASGLLNATIGGRPVNPYQPAGIWSENNTMSPGFVQSKGADLYRRSLYSTVKRTTPVPSMLLFDATSREACATRRPATNTPLQALVLLNDIQFVEAARVLAQVVLKSPVSDAERIKKAFRRLAGREPEKRELVILLQTLSEQRREFLTPTSAENRVGVSDAHKLIAIGESKPDPALDPIELAAMTVVVQTILNSDSVIWKR